MVNKLITIAIVAILVSAAGIGVFIVLHSPNNKSAQITNFSLDGIDTPGGIAWNSKFIVRITSNSDVDDLRVVFNISNAPNLDRTIQLCNPYIYATFKVGEPYRLGALKAGQTMEVNGEIVNNLEDMAKLSGATFTAIIKNGDTILDQANIGMAVWGA
jgi:hypothetical protein